MLTTSAESSLSTQDLANLQEAINIGELSVITSAIVSVNSLKQNVKDNLLHELDEECKHLCLRSEPFELRMNKFCDMVGFEWQKLSSEMSSRCPFLLDVLLIVMNKSKEELTQIIPRLGLCYAILCRPENESLAWFNDSTRYCSRTETQRKK